MRVRREKSCGAVVYTETGNDIGYVIVCSQTGVYGFPKGHVEGNETDCETALREIKEETGLSVTIIPGFSQDVSYDLPGKAGIKKQVRYFAAVFSGQKIAYQKEELTGAWIMSYDEAMEKLQFDSLKQVLSSADSFIRRYRSECRGI